FLDVIKSHDGVVARDGQTALMNRTQRPARRKVVGGKNGGREGRQLPQRPHRSVSSGDARVSRPHEIWIDREAMFLHCLDEGMRTMIRDGRSYHATNKTNLTMSEILEMFYRLIDTGGVVDQYIAQSGTGDSAVHGYQGHAVVDQ